MFSRQKIRDCNGLFLVRMEAAVQQSTFHGNELSQLLKRVDRALLLLYPIIYLFDDSSYNWEAVLPSAFHTEDYILLDAYPSQAVAHRESRCCGADPLIPPGGCRSAR
jgi:hypothetical protein